MEATRQALTRFNNDIENRRGARDTLMDLANDKETEFAILCNKEIMLQKVIKVYQIASTFARAQAKDTMERLVTSALNCVYPEDMAFSIIMSPENEGKAEAELVVTTKYDGYTVDNDPEDGDGGGVSDVVSLATRISLLETSLPRQEGPLVLDEPGKHLGELNRHLAPFLDMVSTGFSRQMIMVTHDDYLAEAAHRSFSVVKKDGISKVTQVS